jgi:DNA polymerase-3 subunit gamma/tau
MGQALYRKYRSRSLDEIVGQQPVTVALKNALKSGNISHAYLFTGPRGTGKTSIARILAFEINKIKYDSDNLPIDIIEIDAASNRKIEEIRDLREKVHIAPVIAKYKVYIIDEVHMLTREAFNALLKTLEEPPQHVIFILATTDAHKLPETIISRTQRYTFQLASRSEVSKHLKSISEKESIAIDSKALDLIGTPITGSGV